MSELPRRRPTLSQDRSASSIGYLDSHVSPNISNGSKINGWKTSYSFCIASTTSLVKDEASTCQAPHAPRSAMLLALKSEVLDWVLDGGGDRQDEQAREMSEEVV